MDHRTARAVGVHRVLEPEGVLPQAAVAPGRIARDRPGRGPDPGAPPQPRRRELPAAPRQALRGRCARAGRGRRDHRHSRQDAEPGDRVRRDARRDRGRGRAGVPARAGGRRPDRDPRVADPDSAADHRRPRALGRRLGAGARARAPRSSSGRSIVAKLPDDLPEELAMSVNDVCGAPALTARVVRDYAGTRDRPDRRRARRGRQERLPEPGRSPRGGGRVARVGIVPVEREAAGPARRRDRRRRRTGRRARSGRGRRCRRRGAGRGSGHHGRVCRRVPGCEHGAVLATADGGTVIFFSMATSFSAAALGAEGLAADVTMLIGNGYTRGHAAYALDLLRTDPAIRALFEARHRRREPDEAPAPRGADLRAVGPGRGRDARRRRHDRAGSGRQPAPRCIATAADADRGPRRCARRACVRRRPRAPHRHRRDPAGTGPARRMRAVRPCSTSSPDEARRLRGRPIVGHGWDETLWADRTLPTREELDRATWGSVVYLSRVDVHSATRVQRADRPGARLCAQRAASRTPGG